MFLYIPAIFQAILFVIALKAVAFYGDLFWLLLVALLALVLVGFRLVTKKWLLWYSVGLFTLSVWTILHLIDYNLEKDIFIFLSAIIYYFFLLGGYKIGKKSRDEVARGIIAMVLMATVFLFLSATYGVYLNFDVASWWLMLFYFINISIISYRYFTIVENRGQKVVLVYSLILGFAMLEMGWVINFWPFGYLTSGFILLMFYYILWDLAQNYFYGNLSKKTVVINLILFIVLTAIVLYSSRWLPRL